MKASGLRLPVDKIRKRLQALRESVSASEFKQELDDYTTFTLKDCQRATPVRRPSVIRANQRKQYSARINCIPTSHDLPSPSMRVKEDGAKLVYISGKWYRPEIHKVPANVWAAFQQLDAERNRRIARISENDFIESRAQARFLYRKTWWQIGVSLGLPVLASANVQDAVTRTHDPIRLPPRAYGQPRGGKAVISYAIYNPFLEIPSRYITFDAATILRDAAAKNKPRFKRQIENHVKRLIRAARRAA